MPPSHYSTHADLLARLLSLKADHTLDEFSSRFGVSSQFMSMVLLGQRGIGQQIAYSLGYRPVTLYEKISDDTGVNVNDNPNGSKKEKEKGR